MADRRWLSVCGEFSVAESGFVLLMGLALHAPTLFRGRSPSLQL